MRGCACIDIIDHAVLLVLWVSCFSWRATSCLNWPTTPFSHPLLLLMLLITDSCIRTATVRTNGIEKIWFIQSRSTLHYVNVCNQLVYPSCVSSVDNCVEDMLSVRQTPQGLFRDGALWRRHPGGFSVCWLLQLSIDWVRSWRTLVIQYMYIQQRVKYTVYCKMDFSSQTALYYWYLEDGCLVYVWFLPTNESMEERWNVVT